MSHLFTTDFARASFFLLFVPPFSIAVPSPHIKGATPLRASYEGPLRPLAKPGSEAAPDRARPRASASWLKLTVSCEMFCAKAQQSNQSMGFGSLFVLRFSLAARRAVLVYVRPRPPSSGTDNAALQHRIYFTPVGGQNARLIFSKHLMRAEPTTQVINPAQFILHERHETKS